MVEDAINTSRPKPGASCLSCKTRDFTEALNKEYIKVNAMDFDEFLVEHAEMEVVSCFDCHKNEPGVINLTNEHFEVGLTSIGAEVVKPGDQSCRQSHTEYYMD